MPENDAVNSRDQHRPFWVQTCEDFMQRLIAYALWLVNGRVYDAEDLVQETVYRILKYLKNPEEVRSPIGYLLTIMRNIWKDKQRKEGRVIMVPLDELLSKEADQKQRRSVEPAVEPDVLRILENNELWDEMRANQGPLSPLEEVLLKLHLEGYSCEEIADRLGVDVHLVSVVLNAARAKVRSRLMKRKR